MVYGFEGRDFGVEGNISCVLRIFLGEEYVTEG